MLQTRFRSFCTLTVSLLIHAGLLWTLGRKPAPPHLESGPFLVELRNQPAEVAIVPQMDSQSTKGSRNGVSKRQISLRQLKLKSSVERVTSGESLLNNEGPSFTEIESYSLGGHVKDTDFGYRGLLEAVYQRVNGCLVFDSLLAQYGHFGTVYFEFRLNHKGQLIADSIRTKAKDAILKVHSLRALRASLHKPLPESYWLREEEAVIVRARFEYAYSEETSLYDENPQRIAGRSLNFRRQTSEKEVPRRLLDQLLSGGVSHDPFSMYESWQKYAKRKERRELDTDPFAAYRADPDYVL